MLGGGLRWTVVVACRIHGLLRAVRPSVSFVIVFQDLAFGGILAFVRQVVRVGVLRRYLFNTMAKLGSIDAQHRLIYLILQHVTCVLLIH